MPPWLLLSLCLWLPLWIIFQTLIFLVVSRIIFRASSDQQWMTNSNKISLSLNYEVHFGQSSHFINGAAAAAGKLLQSCLNSVRPRRQPTRLPWPCDSPGWSGLPFLSPMQENEKWKWSSSVISDSPRLFDCSLPGSSVHGIFPGKSTEVGCHCLLCVNGENLLKVFNMTQMVFFFLSFIVLPLLVPQNYVVISGEIKWTLTLRPATILWYSQDFEI